MSDLSKNQKTVLFLMQVDNDVMRHVEQPHDLPLTHNWTLDKGMKVFCGRETVMGLLEKGFIRKEDDRYKLTAKGSQRAALISKSLTAERQRKARKEKRRAELQSIKGKQSRGKENER